MHAELNLEILKIKVYNEVSKYLRFPSDFQKQQIHTALMEYKEYLAINNNVSCTNELEDVVSQ